MCRGYEHGEAGGPLGQAGFSAHFQAARLARQESSPTDPACPQLYLEEDIKIKVFHQNPNKRHLAFYYETSSSDDYHT